MKIRFGGTEKVFRYQTLNIFCLLYITTWSLVPIFAHYTSGGLFRVLYGAVVFFWIVTGLINLKGNEHIRVISMFIFLSIMILYMFLGYGNISFSVMINYILLLGYGINVPLLIKLPQTIANRLKWYLLFCVVLTSTTTLIALLTYPNASRILTSTTSRISVGTSLELSNVAAFDFIYGIMILFIPIIISMRRDSKSVFLIKTIICALIVGCIWKANFTTCYMLLILSVALYLLIPKTKSIKSLFLTLLVVCFFVFIGPMLLISTLTWIADNSASIYSSSKLYDIMAILSGNKGFAETTSRYDLLMLDIQSFLSSPFIGTGAYYGTSTILTVGQHSQLLDELARYGIIGAMPLFYFVFSSIKYAWRGLDEKGKLNDMFVPTIVFVILSFLNPTFNDGILTCLFIITILLFVGNKEEINENSLYN